MTISLCQLPVTLNQNDSHIISFVIDEPNEHLLYVSATSNTSWSEENNESSILTIKIDDVYNQDIVIYNGLENHIYKQAAGYLGPGEHTIELIFNYNKSSLNATFIDLNNVEFINSNSINLDSRIIEYSPIIYGRNIFSWNESNHTDIPIILFHETNSNTIQGENQFSITYSIIFSNEDSRVGIGLSDMMLSWGRTTDIEWVYTVTLNDENEIISEIFQGASHTTTNFDGEKLNNHPYLINATANCNFSDYGTSDYIFFLSPINVTSNEHTKEYLMDENPWSYKIMGEELINENKYENPQDPHHWQISDIRNYLYIEYNSTTTGEIAYSTISAQFYNNCSNYSNNHNDSDINFNFGNGINRTAIELPENFNLDEFQKLNFETEGTSDYLVTINNIIQIFYINNAYEKINLTINSVDSTITLNNSNPTSELILNDIFINYDCNEELNGNAYCDECGVCADGSTGITPDLNMDDCNVCFGENEAMDCNNVCFGDSYIDDCYICDDNPDNDGETCNAGCIDVNAENYDPTATIFNNSCQYSDRIFNVPEEYNKIQDAIFFTSNNDTVLVQPGIYYEDINFSGKAITLISQEGALETTIIANHSDNETGGGVFEPDKTVITIENTGEDMVNIDGFTIQGGYGKGVNFEYFISVASDPDMFNDMMYNYISSGGITVISSSITLSNLIIENNIAKNFGAGIGLVNSNSILNNIIINNNHIPDIDALGGSGIAINGGATSIDNCIIKNNTVGLNFYQLNGGGGILCGFNFSDTPLELSVTNTQIYNNVANIGAGIGALSGNISLNKTLIYGNTGEYGSTISLGEPLGLVIDDINMIITNSTLANNNGTLSFGMIDNSNVTMVNSILWNNGTSEFTSLPNNSLLNINALYSNIRLYEESIESVLFSSDPLFIDYENDNFNLYANSPCIDNGTNYLILDDNTIVDIQNTDYTGIMPDIGYFELNAAGDINQDNIFNIFDIILIVELILYDSNYIASADLNQDGLITVIDIVELINLILNN